MTNANIEPQPQQPQYQQPQYQQQPQQQYQQPQQQYQQPQQQYQQQFQPQRPLKSKVVAGLLGIFLGTLGLHNFYVGRTGLGLIQLLLSLTFFGALITAPWTFIEGILYLVGSGDHWSRDAQGYPLV